MSLDVSLSYDGNEVYGWNITHNLNKMAEAAGFYGPLWRPDQWEMSTNSATEFPESPITKAFQLTPHIEKGIAELKSRPAFYKSFDSPNGWGTYKDFVPLLEELLAQLKKMPNADLSVSR